MNKCSFLGQVGSLYKKQMNDVPVVYLKLNIENKRQTRASNRMDMETLDFEAWGSAADTIIKNLREGDLFLIVDATARRCNQGVRFRINEFRFLD
jgi:single-stranded DNA-binding protein